MRIHLATTLWGDEFTRLYLSLCLPNQLSPGNLPALAAGAMPVYKIYTRVQDADVIAANLLFQHLTTLMPTELIALDHLFADGGGSRGNTLLMMSVAHRAAVDAANTVDAALMFLPPDQIYSDGAFARCLELANKGTRAVMVAGIRFDKEALEPIVVRRRAESGETGDGAPRTLLNMALPHLSSISRAMFADANPFSEAPSHLYFQVRDEGFVVRALHLHPLFMHPRRRVPFRYGNCDTDYLLDACPSAEDYHIVSDSDEMVALELTPSGREHGQYGSGPLNTKKLRAFYWRSGNRLLRGFLWTPIFIHTADVTAEWPETARRSEAVIRRALGRWSSIVRGVRL